MQIGIREVDMEVRGKLYPVLLPPAPEGGLIDSKNIGGFLERFCGGKHTADVLLLDLFKGDRISDPRRGFLGRQFFRKVFGVRPDPTGRGWRPARSRFAVP